MRLGRPYIFKRLLPPWILNFPTKGHWRAVANLDDIIRGLEYLKSHFREWGIESLAVPPLGCGQGQLEWRVVGLGKTLMATALVRRVLAKHYGFTDGELDFIINYDIKYRMGQEAVDEEEDKEEISK